MLSLSATARQPGLPAKIRALSGESESDAITDRCAPIKNAPESRGRTSRRDILTEADRDELGVETSGAKLSQRAKDFAAAQRVTWYESLGAPPTILFPADFRASRHGNFIDDSYRAILANPPWAERLGKAHSQRRALPEDRRADAKELDSCNSSDALLMNCFCYPTAAAQIFQRLLPLLPVGPLEFGVAGDVPLQDGRSDATEVDMRTGRVIFECKLTETDFTERPRAHVERYRDLSEVFDVSVLPQTALAYRDYQLIRNVLVATAHGYHFVLLCDGRRPDLLHEWWQVHGAIRTAQLRAKCHFLLWQEVADVCPVQLQEFLHAKYGL